MSVVIGSRRLAAALVFVLSAGAAAQQSVAPLSWGQEQLRTTKLGTPRTVFVALPEGYSGNDRRYNVLVVLDASDKAQFRAAVANVAFLADRSVVPPMIVVGVPNGADRTRDLTPVPTGNTATRFRTAGGSSDFADFLTSDVLPMVHSKYRTLPATILAGHSFGGLFAIELAARRPGAFAGVIAMSPSLWWNDSTVVAEYADAIAQSPHPLRLYATSGELEAPIDRVTKRFAARIDSLKPDKVAFRYRFYPETDHGMTPSSSLVDGLKFLFERTALASLPTARVTAATDSAAFVQAVLESETMYREGARYFGLGERLPESVLNVAGFRALRQLRNPSLAVWVFRRNVALYPESVSVYEGLGDAYLAQGDTEMARVTYQRSIDTAVRTKVVPSPNTIAKLNQLERGAGSP
jgi:predicted alpha/beta superfamily hydrolase